MGNKNITATADNLALMYMSNVRSGPRQTPEDIAEEFFDVRRRIAERLMSMTLKE